MSGLGYTYQSDSPIILIGTKSGTTVSASALTASFASAASATTGGMSKVNVGLQYTTGAAETGNTVTVKVETSNDGTNWFQLVNESVSGGVSTIAARTFEFTGSASATTYNFSLPLDVQDKFMRFSFKEQGVASNFGTLFAEAVFSGGK